MFIEETLIIHAADLLEKEISSTGNYGKLTPAHKKNEEKKKVAKHIKRNSEAICKLIFEDRNIYLENDIFHKNDLLNKFVNSMRPNIDIETFKLLKESISVFLSKKDC